MSDPTTRRYLTDDDRRRLKAETASPVTWSTGAEYPRPHSDFTEYQTFRSTARPQLTKAQATQQLIEFLTPGEPLPLAQQSALGRLRVAMHMPTWDSSLVIKALPDLDTAFFDGRLKGNVVVVWASEADILEKACGRERPGASFLGMCQPLDPSEKENEGQQRCKIWLNVDQIFEVPDPQLEMWKTIFHELVHAYTLITSDRDYFIDYHASSVDPFHDDQFKVLVSIVDRRSIRFLQIPAFRPGEGHTFCLSCNARPTLHGDADFGNDEQGEMKKAQQKDPSWPKA